MELVERPLVIIIVLIVVDADLDFIDGVLEATELGDDSGAPDSELHFSLKLNGDQVGLIYKRHGLGKLLFE